MSSTDPDPTRDVTRRKFDEVASLFGPIVPPAGSPVRPRTLKAPSTLPQASDDELGSEDGLHLEPPPRLRAPLEEPLLSRPPAEPRFPPAAVLPTVAPVIQTVGPVVPTAQTRSGPNPSATPARPTKPVDVRAQKNARVERKADAAMPWPDAFVPRPNYQRSQKSRLLYWLFLIPFAVVVVVAVTFVDPRSIRAFIDQTFLQYLPAEITQYFARPATSLTRPEPLPPALLPLAPPPVSSTEPSGVDQPAVPASPPTVPAPVAPALEVPPVAPLPAAPDQPQPATPTAATPFSAPPPISPAPEAPAAVDAPAAEPGRDPAARTSSEPAGLAAPDMPAAAAPTVPPVTNEPSEAVAAPSPPPSAAPPSAPAAGPPRVTIYYRRGQSGAEGEARRVAAKLGNAEIKPSISTARSPMIYFFNPGDREAATGIARALAGEGQAGWIVRAGPTRPTSGAIDIFLP